MKKGFSLVELSIVLVILGLLTGGILAGQNLIRAAELRSFTTQIQQFEAAAFTFRDKYFALPGDMRNATDFWGTTTCPGTAGTGTQTCNGDGNGLVQVSGAANQYNEIFTYWQHLANAGLIEGSYTGMAGSGGNQSNDPGVNTPRLKIGNSLIAMIYWPASAGDANAFAGIPAGHRYNFRSTGGGAILAPEEAWNIDTKMDDGRPGYGQVIAFFWNGCTTATANSQRNIAEYNLTDTSLRCGLEVFND